MKINTFIRSKLDRTALYCLFGYACIMGWLDVLLRANSAFSIAAPSFVNQLSLSLYIPFIMSAGLTLIVVGVYHARAERALQNMVLNALCACCLAALSIALTAPSFDEIASQNPYLYIIASCLAGIFWAFISLAWNRIMGTFSCGVLFAIIVSCIGASVVLASISQMGFMGYSSLVLLPLLPFLSVICLYNVREDYPLSTSDDLSCTKAEAHLKETLRSQELYISFAVALSWAAFSTNLCLAISVGIAGSKGSVLVNLLCAAVLLAFIVVSFHGQGMRFSTAYRVLLFMLVAGQLLLSFAFSGAMAPFAVAAQNGTFLSVRACFWCIVVFACNRMAQPLRMLSIGVGLGFIFIGLGVLVGLRLSMAFSQGLGSIVGDIICALSIMFTLYIYTTILSERDIDTLMETLPQRKRSFVDCCKLVAEKYKLSPRETDVFVLIATGRDINYIQEALLLSKSTVSTHRGHIYKKLGVHSRQEAIDIVENHRSSVIPLNTVDA